MPEWHRGGEIWRYKKMAKNMLINKFEYRNLPRNDNLKNKASELRRAGNLAEVIFWQNFKDKNQLGFDIDRQYIIGNYIVDFFIPELGLVFEIDGQSHDSQGSYDETRELFLKNLGLEVIHFTDKQIRYQITDVKQIILDCINNQVNKLIKENQNPHPAIY